MKSWKFVLLIYAVLVRSAMVAQSQCTGCTTTVNSTTTTNYTVAAGQTLCITTGGMIKGSITMSGGTICNEGTIQASAFTVTGGVINNYGNILQTGNLEMSNGSILNNYNFVEVQQKFLLNPPAKYLSQNTSAVLWVYPFSATISPSATAPYAKLSRRMDGGIVLVPDGYLYFQYDEEYVAGTFKYKIYDNNKPADTNHNVVMSNTTDALPAKVYGDNRYQLKVACKIGLGDYILEVTNDKNEVSYLRFKVNILQYCP